MTFGGKKNYLVPYAVPHKTESNFPIEVNKSFLSIVPIEELLPKHHSFQRQSGAHSGPPSTVPLAYHRVAPVSDLLIADGMRLTYAGSYFPF